MNDRERAQHVIAYNFVRRLLRQPGRRKGDLPLPDALQHLSPSQQARYFAWKADSLIWSVFGDTHLKGRRESGI